MTAILRKRRRKSAKPVASPTESTLTDLQEARDIKRRIKNRIDTSTPDDLPKLVDSYSRQLNSIRQLEKARRKELEEFSDDELIEYVRSLPERRRDALITAAQGTSLAGKSLF